MKLEEKLKEIKQKFDQLLERLGCRSRFSEIWAPARETLAGLHWAAPATHQRSFGPLPPGHFNIAVTQFC